MNDIKKKQIKPDKQVSNRYKTGKFIKGKSGNPKGRPKISYMEQLNEAIRTVEVGKKKPLFIRFVEQAYANPSIMIALMGKLLANQQHTEITGLEPLKFEVEILNGNSKPKSE